MLFRRKNRQNEIEIQMEDVELIMGRNFQLLESILKSVFCERCSGQTKIEDFKILLDDTNDIIFDGRCATCKNEVSRYVETGESTASSDMATHIRSVKKLDSSRLN